MAIREKFFNAMRRRDESYIPFEFSLCPALRQEFERRTGEKDYAEYYNFPTRSIYVKCVNTPERFHKYYKNLDNIYIWPDWGVGERKGSVAHFTEMQHPMADFSAIEDFESYPYPDPVSDFDWEEYENQVVNVKGRDLIANAGMQITIFEIAWYLRGMDNFMIDMAINPELASYHLERITQIRCELARRFARAGSDVLSLGDDVSTQLSMMMHPDMWREFLKPRLKRVIDAARNEKPDIMIFYHGDGNLQQIIPDLIEIGVDMLNPVQPECMNPVDIKEKYGDRLSFWGTIGTQTTMPFGSAEDVRNICGKMIREVGKGGGFLLAPTHLLEPEVPWENIEAFIETVKEYNEAPESRLL